MIMSSKRYLAVLQGLLVCFLLSLPGPSLAQVPFIRGDLSGDGEVTLVDAILLARSVADRSVLPCRDSGDINDNGLISLGDVALLMEFLLNGWTAPSAPFPGVGADPTEDMLGCNEVPSGTTDEDPESFYSLTATPLAAGIRLRVSLKNSRELIGGSLSFAFPEGWSRDSVVMDVRSSLELSMALEYDHMVMGEFGKDGVLRIVWLLSIAGKEKALSAGQLRQLLDITLCPAATPPGDYRIEPSGLGEIVAEDGASFRVESKGASVSIEEAGAPCGSVPRTNETIRPYVWMGDIQAMAGGRFRVPFYSMVNVEYLTVGYKVKWNPEVLRVVWVDKVTPKGLLGAFLLNYDGYDPWGRSVHYVDDSLPYLWISYCDPCNSHREDSPSAYLSIYDYVPAEEAKVAFFSYREYYQFDLIFEVLPGAQAGAAWIEFVENPTNGKCNYIWPPGRTTDVYYPARPLFPALVTVLPWEATDSFIRGDADFDGAVSITDPIRTFSVLFLGSGAFPCPDSADSNDDGALDITDGVCTLSFLFLGSSPPPTPFPEAGEDETVDELGCMEG
jgi:hypothetical protein